MLEVSFKHIYAVYVRSHSNNSEVYPHVIEVDSEFSTICSINVNNAEYECGLR